MSERILYMKMKKISFGLLKKKILIKLNFFFLIKKKNQI